MARGRHQKPYQPSWGGDPVVGLYRCHDGRWRINAINHRYTEADERRAIQKFQDWQQQNHPSTISLPIDPSTDLPSIHAITTIDGQPVPHDSARFVLDVLKSIEGNGIYHPTADVGASYPLPENQVWQWMRDMLLNHSAEVAKKTGIPESLS
jgi:hypothetical protein